jgi:hypothetical protein
MAKKTAVPTYPSKPGAITPPRANGARSVNNPGRRGSDRLEQTAPRSPLPAPARGRPDGVTGAGQLDPGSKVFTPTPNPVMGEQLVIRRRTFPSVNGGANRE